MFSIQGLPDHLQIAGSVNGAINLSTVRAQGRACAWRAAQSLGLNAGAVNLRFQRTVAAMSFNHPWPIFQASTRQRICGLR